MLSIHSFFYSVVIRLMPYDESDLVWLFGTQHSVWHPIRVLIYNYWLSVAVHFI